MARHISQAGRPAKRTGQFGDGPVVAERSELAETRECE